MKQQSSGWKTESGYILSMIGSAVGFANILAFSAQAYLNGGGAFLIPFAVALIILGIPMLFLEGAVGNTFGLPLVSTYRKLAGTAGAFWGWLAVIACITIGGFYIVLTGYSIAYSFFSATDSISSNTAYFFKHVFLKDSGSISSFGGFAGIAFVCTLLSALFAGYVLSKNIQKGIERACSIFLPLLAVLIVLFTIAVCFLPGALKGIGYFLYPDFSKLLQPKLWLRLFGHLFFSLSLGLGIVTGYSRHTKKNTNIRRAMIYVALGDFAISFIAGLAIFGCIGYMSHISTVPFDKIIRSDSIFEIGFITFPIILKTFGPMFYRIFGALFFFCIFIAGITGVFSIMESVVGNIEIEYAFSRKHAVFLTTAIMLVISVFFCMGNGTHLLGALEPMVMGYNMLIGGIAQIITFLYFSQPIQNHAVWYKDGKYIYAYYVLKYCAIIILPTILIWNLYGDFSQLTLSDAVMWGWFACALLIATFLATRTKKAKLVKI